jgi:hypothetical protein
MSTGPQVLDPNAWMPPVGSAQARAHIRGRAERGHWRGPGASGDAHLPSRPASPRGPHPASAQDRRCVPLAIRDRTVRRNSLVRTSTGLAGPGGRGERVLAIVRRDGARASRASWWRTTRVLGQAMTYRRRSCGGATSRGRCACGPSWASRGSWRSPRSLARFGAPALLGCARLRRSLQRSTSTPARPRSLRLLCERSTTRWSLSVPAVGRLALEMVAHEATERAAFDVELAALTAARRDAEEIAEIADAL